jgi:hypothetical protein
VGKVAPVRTIAVMSAAVALALVAAAPAAAIPRTFDWVSPPGPGGPFAEGGVEFPSGNGGGEVCGARREAIFTGSQSLQSAATPDGAHVFFTTSDKMVAADTDSGKRDIYEFSGGQTRLVSDGIPAADSTFFLGCSEDGTHVTFGSASLTFVELWQTVNGGTASHVNVSETAEANNDQVNNVAMSADGTKVMFDTAESLTSDDTDAGAGRDVFERSGNDTKLVSKPGTTAGFSSLRAVSADGTKIWFDSPDQLEAAKDTNSTSDTYLASNLGSPTVVSIDADTDTAAGDSGFFAAVPDGSHVFFGTTTGLDSTDLDGAADLYDRHGTATTWLSKPDPGQPDDTFQNFVAASPDASLVYFTSNGQLKSSDTDSSTDLYLRSGTALKHITQQVAGNEFGVVAGCSEASVIRGCAATDGSRLFFSSQEELLPSDTDFNDDVYRYTASSDTLELASGNGTHGAVVGGVSENGARVLFDSQDPLACQDTDAGEFDTYEWEDGALSLVTLPSGSGSEGNVLSSITADASTVFFASNARYAGSNADGVAIDMFAARPGGTTPPCPVPGGGGNSGGGGGGGGATAAAIQCGDGRDNDADGAIDKADPGCRTSADGDESDESLRDLFFCGRRELSLVRADLRGGRVVLTGLVAPRLAGSRVALSATFGKRRVSLGSVRPRADGQFTARVKAPSRRLRGRARYQAAVGKSRSVKLKLAQSLESTSVKLKGGNVELRGTVKRSLLGKRNKVVIKRLVCGKLQATTTAKPNRRGVYVARFKAPALASAALYRAETRVLSRPGSRRYVRQFARAIGITIKPETG